MMLILGKMIIVKSSLVAVVIALVCLSVCKASKCTGGVDQSVMNNRCVLSCGETKKCLCAKDENPNSITDCQQNCDKHPGGNINITVNKCPDMECIGLERCFQNCKHGKCSMQCKANKMCSQECSASCTKIVCSSGECIQSCKNCTMECTSGAKSCQQNCRGGICYYKCNAKACHKSCQQTVPGEKCELKVVADSAGHHSSALPLVQIVFLAMFLVKMIH